MPKKVISFVYGKFERKAAENLNVHNEDAFLFCHTHLLGGLLLGLLRMELTHLAFLA